MSSDNAIFYIEYGDEWFVWHGSLSADYYEPETFENGFPSKEEAISFANALHDKIGYTEGGIIYVDKESKITAIKSQINHLKQILLALKAEKE
jgi:hypothetical protein